MVLSVPGSFEKNLFCTTLVLHFGFYPEYLGLLSMVENLYNNEVLGVPNLKHLIDTVIYSCDRNVIGIVPS